MTSKSTINVNGKALEISVRAAGKVYVVVARYDTHKVRTSSISHTIALFNAYSALQPHIS